MRLLIFYDLPVKTPSQRRQATQFRQFLLNDGFYMMQYSVYVRVCNGQDALRKHRIRVRSRVPRRGSVRALAITEKQYQSIEIMLGPTKEKDKAMEYVDLTVF